MLKGGIGGRCKENVNILPPQSLLLISAMVYRLLEQPFQEARNCVWLGVILSRMGILLQLVSIVWFGLHC